MIFTTVRSSGKSPLLAILGRHKTYWARSCDALHEAVCPFRGPSPTKALLLSTVPSGPLPEHSDSVTIQVRTYSLSGEGLL